MSFNIEYTFKDVPGAYRALEEIAEKLVSQLEIINSSIKQENISGKISDYKKSFNQIMKEMGS